MDARPGRAALPPRRQAQKGKGLAPLQLHFSGAAKYLPDGYCSRSLFISRSINSRLCAMQSALLLHTRTSGH
jgi:hypothetical protein